MAELICLVSSIPCKNEVNLGMFISGITENCINFLIKWTKPKQVLRTDAVILGYVVEVFGIQINNEL